MHAIKKGNVITHYRERATTRADITKRNDPKFITQTSTAGGYL